jgi:hypothetical protein
VAIVVLHEFFDSSNQFTDASEATTANGLLSNQAELCLTATKSTTPTTRLKFPKADFYIIQKLARKVMEVLDDHWTTIAASLNRSPNLGLVNVAELAA